MRWRRVKHVLRWLLSRNYRISHRALALAFRARVHLADPNWTGDIYENAPPRIRARAKAYNLGFMYGAGPTKLSKTYDMTSRKDQT